MFGDVVERFLRDPVERDLDLRRQERVVLDGALRRAWLRAPLQRGGQQDKHGEDEQALSHEAQDNRKGDYSKKKNGEGFFSSAKLTTVDQTETTITE